MRQFFFALFIALPLHAEDWTAHDGTVYKGVKVLKHDAATVTFMYQDGGVTVPISTLPLAVQKELGYDVSKAEAKITADKKAALANLQRREAAKATEQAREQEEATAQFIAGDVVYVGNGYIEIYRAPANAPQPDDFEAAGGAYRGTLSSQVIQSSRRSTVGGQAGGTFIVKNDPNAANRAVGDSVSLKVYPCGTAIDAFGTTYHAYSVTPP